MTLNIHDIALIAGGAGEIIISIPAQMAALERGRIAARAEAGRKAARNVFAERSQTKRCKESRGLPFAAVAAAGRAW